MVLVAGFWDYPPVEIGVCRRLNVTKARGWTLHDPLTDITFTTIIAGSTGFAGDLGRDTLPSAYKQTTYIPYVA